jgi:hypothetical protein
MGYSIYIYVSNDRMVKRESPELIFPTDSADIPDD